MAMAIPQWENSEIQKGKPYYAEGIFIDITKQKSIEESLIQKMQRSKLYMKSQRLKMKR